MKDFYSIAPLSPVTDKHARSSRVTGIDRIFHKSGEPYETMYDLYRLEEAMDCDGDVGVSVTRHYPSYVKHYRITRHRRLIFKKVVFNQGQVLQLNYEFKGDFIADVQGVLLETGDKINFKVEFKNGVIFTEHHEDWDDEDLFSK